MAKMPQGYFVKMPDSVDQNRAEHCAQFDYEMCTILKIRSNSDSYSSKTKKRLKCRPKIYAVHKYMCRKIQYSSDPDKTNVR